MVTHQQRRMKAIKMLGKLVSFSDKQLRPNLLRSRPLCSPSHSPHDSDELDAASSASHHLPPVEPSRDADLISAILTRHHNPFHAMESSLELHGVALTPSLFNQTLLRLRHSSKIALAFFHYSKSLPTAAEDSPPLLSAASYNILVDALGRVRQFDVAWQLIAEMDQNTLTTTTGPNLSTFLILIRRLIAAGLTRQAVRAFDDVETFLGHRPGPRDYAFLIDTLCKYGHVRQAAELFNAREKSGAFVPDVKAFTVVIDGWCKIGERAMGERFFEDMVRRGIEPNVVTFNVLLNGICRRASLHPDGRFARTMRKAEKVLEEMRRRGIEPDAASFSVVVHVCSRAHKPDLALDKLREMRAVGVAPTAATYTSVVKCLCSCGRLEEAEEMVAEMSREGIRSPPETFNCFLKEYRGRKDFEGAMKLYRRIKSEGLCEPSAHTFNILIGMLLGLGKKAAVKEVWEDMRASGAGPDLDTYTMTVQRLCEAKRWREACELYSEMIQKGFLPQKVTFKTLYKGLVNNDKSKTWARMKSRVESEAITFGSEFDNYALKPYSR